MTTVNPKSLKQLRQDQALGVKALARLAGVSNVTILKMERGEPIRMDAVRRLAKALDVEPMAISEYVRQRENEAAAQGEP